MPALARSTAALVVVILAAFATAGIGVGQTPHPSLEPDLTQWTSELGDPNRGHDLIVSVGCGSCHIIPGVVDADGLVGPPLDHMGRRQYVAGVLRNTPDNMVHWLRAPQAVVPGNAMPDMDLSEDDARQIAAYLYTLQ